MPTGGRSLYRPGRELPDTSVAPWLFEGTGLENGDTLGEEVGGFGIEIDQTTPLSPPGTKVLALIPNLFGPGLHAEMAYYETDAGARVWSGRPGADGNYRIEVVRQPDTGKETLIYTMAVALK